MAEQNLEQRRAAYALKCVEKLKESNSYDKYVSYVSAFPAMILSNGLGQSAATLLAQAANAQGKTSDHRSLYSHISDWLCGEDEAMPYRGGGELIKAITSRDQDHYLKAQAEALALLEWLKKFAVAFLKDKGRD